MNAVVRFITDYLVREEGQTLTEYGLLLFFIAVATIAAVTAFGVNVTAMFQNAANQLAAL